MAGQSTIWDPSLGDLPIANIKGAPPPVPPIIDFTGEWTAQLMFSVVPPNGILIMRSSPNDAISQLYPGCWTEAFSGGDLGTLTSINFSNLVGIRGFTPDTFSALKSLSVPSLEVVFGNFSPANMDSLVALSAPVLSVINGQFNPHGMASLTTLSIPSLAYVSGLFTPSNMASLTALSAPSLISCGDFSPNNLPSLTSLSIPFLSKCFTFAMGGAALETINAPVLKTIMNGIQVGANYIESMPALTTMTFPQLVTLINGITMASGNQTDALTTFTIGASLKTVTGDVIIESCALNQSSVDGLLERLASLNGSSGTTVYQNQTVTITGTSSAPSSAGAAAVVTLQGRGCTVTTN